MRQFIKRALSRLDKLSLEQFRDLLVSSSQEIDRLETVIDSSVRGILVCDIKHKLILANKAARRFLSIISFEQSKESIWNLIPDERVSEFLADTLLSGDKAEEKEFEIDLQGMHKLLSVSIMSMVQEQKVSGSLIFVDDITERRNREARLRRMENLASLTTLAAGVAHEIKNPLGSLSIHVQLIQKAIIAQAKVCPEFHRQPEFHQQIDKYMNILTEEVERLNAIVVDFLFAVRPMNAELKRGDINALITELADFVSLELKEAHVDIALNLTDIPTIDFDSSLIKQALFNLIKNATAAMIDGGKLTISTNATETDVIITVADTGTGISLENFDKIFDPYFTTKDNGTGLGLTMVFKIIKEHQGEINVESREGEGSVFTVTLPMPQLDRRLIGYAGRTE